MKTTPHELMDKALEHSILRYERVVSTDIEIGSALEDGYFFGLACGRLDELAGIDDEMAKQLRSDSNYGYCPCCYAATIITSLVDAPAHRNKCQYCPIIKAVNKGIVDAKHYQYCNRIPRRGGEPEFLEDLKTIRSWWGVKK